MKKEFKDFFYSLPPEELEKILDCIDVPDKLDTETLNRIKAKTKEKCGLTKKKKIFPKRMFVAAIYLLLFTAAVIGINIDFWNDSLVTSDASDEESTASSDVSHSISVPDESMTESQTVSCEEELKITGINWGTDHSSPSVLNGPFDAVKEILDTDISLRSEPAWATVILESITPIGTIEREYYPEYHFSVAEIKILEFHYYGKDLKDVAKKGDTIKIIVPYIIDNDEVIMSYGSYYSLDRKETHIFPMTEVGKKYVVSIYERADSETLYRMSGTNQRYCEFAEVAEIWEGYIKDNCPELSGVNLDLLSSYPMFSMDVSETMNLNAYRFDPGWVQMYVAIYDRYMKGNISESAPETQFYELYNRNVYNYYAMTLQRTP